MLMAGASKSQTAFPMEGEVSVLARIEAGERPSLSLDLPDGLAFDEWVTIGRRLCLGSQALQWHIGDWWAFGDHRYGDRAKAAAEGLFGREFGSLANLATVARTFETSRRREVLTFTHHVEVAALPADKAEQLLEKAEREHLSTRDLRREVHALRAANDPEAVTVESAAAAPRPIPTHSAKSELTAAYEMAIEFAEALEKMRPFTKRERRLYTEAREFVSEAHSGHRQCPADFDVIFVEKGRLECETWYRASRMTVNRWLLERGKTRLVRQRADYIQFRRDERRAPVAEQPTGPLTPIDEKLHAVAREAASYLRVSRYGGWTITATSGGAWLVGTVRKTSDELIAMAERQGFGSIGAGVALRATGVTEVEAGA